MPRLRSVCLAWGTLAVVVAGGAIGDGWRPWSQPPAQAAHGALVSVDSEGTGAIAPLGRVLPLRTSDGRIVDVAVLGVTYRMAPAREAQVVDGSDQLLTALPASDLRPALRPGLLRPGHPLAGWVTFTRPTAARVLRVQVTLDAGTGPHTGQWRVRSQS
jgi:hypothetical protein